MAFKVEDVLVKLGELKDRQDEIAARHKAEMAPIADGIDNLEKWLQAELLKVGTDSFKVKGVGTFTTKTSEFFRCKAEEWPALFKWVVDHDRPDLLKKDISPSVAKEILNVDGFMPPGVQLTVMKKPSFTHDRKGRQSEGDTAQ